MDACDSFPCSTSLCSMLYKDAKALKYQCFGRMVAKGMDDGDNVSCSASFAQCVVQRGENTVNTDVFGMDAI